MQKPLQNVITVIEIDEDNFSEEQKVAKFLHNLLENLPLFNFSC